MNTGIQMRPITAAIVATLCAAAALPARADDSDSVPANTLRVGEYHVMYNTTSTDITGPLTPSGLQADAKNLDTLYLGYVRKLSTHFMAELVLATPPLADTLGKGPATVGSVPFNGQVIAKARWLAPSALLDYEFFDDSSAWRPYVGFGVNYTTFYDRQSTTAGNQASGGPTRISLTSSFGPAGTMGISWHPLRHVEINASYSAAIVSSSMTTDTAGVIRHARIQFLPTPLIFSVGYSF